MLRLSPQVQSQTAVGVIMNHVTVDLARIRLFWSYTKDFIIAPTNVSQFFFEEIFINLHDF